MWRRAWLGAVRWVRSPGVRQVTQGMWCCTHPLQRLPSAAHTRQCAQSPPPTECDLQSNVQCADGGKTTRSPERAAPPAMPAGRAAAAAGRRISSRNAMGGRWGAVAEKAGRHRKRDAGERGGAGGADSWIVSALWGRAGRCGALAGAPAAARPPQRKNCACKGIGECEEERGEGRGV